MNRCKSAISYLKILPEFTGSSLQKMHIQIFNEKGIKNKAVQGKYSLFKGSKMDLSFQ